MRGLYRTPHRGKRRNSISNTIYNLKWNTNQKKIWILIEMYVLQNHCSRSIAYKTSNGLCLITIIDCYKKKKKILIAFSENWKNQNTTYSIHTTYNRTYSFLAILFDFLTSLFNVNLLSFYVFYSIKNMIS